MTKTLETTNQYLTIDHAYQFYNEKLFSNKLPECLLTFQRLNSVEGYYKKDSFTSKLKKLNIDEIALNPDFFYNNDKRVLSTLVHEMCHLWQFHHGTPSRNGYHNKQWANKMESVGLMPSDTGLPNGNKTGDHMSDYIISGGLFDNVSNELVKDKIINWYSKGFTHTATDIVSIIDNALIEIFSPSAVNTGGFIEIDSNNFQIESVTELEEDNHYQIKIKNDLHIPLFIKENDNIYIHQRPPKNLNRYKIKYTCPACYCNVWGKPNLNIYCGDCEESMTEAE